MRGYKEEGTTTTPFDMCVLNDLDRFHLVSDVIDRVPKLGARAAYAKQAIRDKLMEHKAVHRAVRRRHAGDHGLEVGAAGRGVRERALDGGRQCMRSELLGTLRRRDAGGRRDTYSAHQADMNVSPGRSFPLGATPVEGGVNFCVFSSEASRLELLLFDGAGDAEPARVIRLEAPAHRTYHYWHAFVPGLRPGQVYAYRAVGPFDPARGLRFDPAKVLLDPYGRAVVVPDGYDRGAASRPGDNTAVAMRSVVVDPDAYDWEGDAPLRRPFATTVIYEMHVAGFTRHPSSGVGARTRGTYAGMIEKIPYLQDLGITAVELLPVFQFDRAGLPARPGQLLGLFPGLLLRSARRLQLAPGPARARRRVPGPRQGAAPRGHRGDPGRRLQPHGGREPRGADAVASAASTTRRTTSSRPTARATRTTPAPATR